MKQLELWHQWQHSDLVMMELWPVVVAPELESNCLAPSKK